MLGARITIPCSFGMRTDFALLVVLRSMRCDYPPDRSESEPLEDRSSMSDGGQCAPWSMEIVILPPSTRPNPRAEEIIGQSTVVRATECYLDMVFLLAVPFPYHLARADATFRKQRVCRRRLLTEQCLDG